ncbi:MAG TPA: glycosyltransferase family 2 protein [Acidobacteriota bacterium]|jgi:glycosyltransferase involved in cell wall biosynthesis
MFNEQHEPMYSVVIPFHNEQESIRELYAILSDVMERLQPCEFVFVDDHSTDATPQLLGQLARDDSRVVMIRLKRNYGQTTALAAGFEHARGEVIISMDGDLQHDPRDIPSLLSVFEETGCDIVSGWRKNRVDNFLFRRLPSRIANWLMSKLSGVNIHDFGTTYKVYRRDTIRQIRLYGEMHRFIPALASWNGATIVEAPIRSTHRPNGQSHYGLSRTIRVLFDILTVRFLLRYVTRPLHFFGPAGLLGISAGIFIALWLVLEKLIYDTDLFEQHGPLMLFGIVLFLGGVQLISSGLVAELISRTYFESQGKSVYSIEKIVRKPGVSKNINRGERQER